MKLEISFPECYIKRIVNNVTSTTRFTEYINSKIKIKIDKELSGKIVRDILKKTWDEGFNAGFEKR